jgi:superfamily I DNA/RNA helicase
MSHTLLIADSVFDAAEDLNGVDKGRVFEALTKLRKNPAHPSLSLERVTNAKSDGIWSARVSRDLRLILLREGDTTWAVHVGHHDPAYDWATRHRVERHQITGGLQIVEAVESVEGVRKALGQPPAPAVAALPPRFADHADAYLLSLGVPPDWLTVLREVRTDDQLLTVCDKLPADVADRLFDLAAGQLVTPPVPEKPGTTESGPEVRRRFYVADDEDELRAALEAPHARWIAFLHPSQRALAENSYRGPVKVTGGAGTGKTVVAMHRARNLARAGQRVLLTSYVTTLCSNIEKNIRLLCQEAEARKITVSTVDREALAIVRTVRPGVAPATDDEVRATLGRILERSCPAGFEPAFVRAEWTNVVQNQGLGAWDDYRVARRVGRGRGLTIKERRALWNVFEAVLADLARRDLVDFPGLCREATQLLESGKAKSPFDAVLVDEVQDLRPPALRFVRALCVADLGKLMLLGDASQRIYPGGFSLNALGIEVRGRSHVLKINYRTTDQIRRAADGALGETHDDLDGAQERRTATRSLLRGPKPKRVGHSDGAAEDAAALRTIQAWIVDGIPAEGIAVFSRAPTKRLEALEQALHGAGLATHRLADDGKEQPVGVGLGTLHRAKGLEFRAVLILDASDGVLPSPSAFRGADDPQDKEDALTRERHLLHVGMSRARDELAISWSGKPSSLVAELDSTLFEEGKA